VSASLFRFRQGGCLHWLSHFVMNDGEAARYVGMWFFFPAGDVELLTTKTLAGESGRTVQTLQFDMSY